MEDFYGIKELYNVDIRALRPIDIGSKRFDTNESILSFKTAELARVDENKKFVSANGGYHNPALVNWEVDKEIKFGITHGVLSPKSWSILSNSKLFNPKTKSVPYQEELDVIEDSEYCFCNLKFIPNACLELMGVQGNPNNEPMPMGRRPELMLKPLPPSKEKYIFCYDYETGERIRNFDICGNRIFLKSSNYRKVFVDYTFDYNGGIELISIGNRLNNGFFRLTATMTNKSEISGEVNTTLLEIPKLKFQSSLSIQLGKNCDNSVVSDFFFVGYPDEDRKDKQKTAIITFLDSELTGDYI